MSDITEFKKRQIVGARMAGASVTKIAELLGFSRAPTKTMAEFKKHGRPPATRVIPAGLSNLPTEIDVYLDALWEESI